MGDDLLQAIVARCERELEENTVGPYDSRAKVDSFARDILRLAQSG